MLYMKKEYISNHSLCNITAIKHTVFDDLKVIKHTVFDDLSLEFEQSYEKRFSSEWQ